MTLIERVTSDATRAAQALTAVEAAAMLEDPLAVAVYGDQHGLTGPFGLAALRRALTNRSGRPGARVHASPAAPRIVCPSCELEHPAKWRASDRTWVAQHCDRRRWTLDFQGPEAEMCPSAIAAGVERMRRHAWAFQDIQKHDTEAIRRVLLALETREAVLVKLLRALREVGVPAELLEGVANETWINLDGRK